MYDADADSIIIDDITDIDDAADTLRFVRLDIDDVTTDPDATSFYDLMPPHEHLGIQRASAARRRLIRDTRQEIAGLRAAIAAGWGVDLELAYEERRLARLMGDA